MTAKQLDYINSPFSNSNTLIEHVRELNKLELQEREIRRQNALNRIRDLRRAIKEQRELDHDQRT